MTSINDIALNPNELEAFYPKYFGYYNTLNAVYKQIFIQRCLLFISEKEISGVDGFAVNNAIKAIVAASAVQLTLGLDTWSLKHFDEIHLHASNFDSPNGNTKYTGLTSLRGNIKLSWKSFIHGYQIPDDNKNLGLHEFSHALQFSGINGSDQDYFVKHYFNKWLTCAKTAFSDLKNKRSNLFRQYGETNINEFISVCIEHYFESPQEIKQEYPLLYYATGILLNQCSNELSTEINIRNRFLAQQNEILPGMGVYSFKDHFLKNWTSKLFLFLFIILVYTYLNGTPVRSVNIAVLTMLVIAYVWYDWNAAKIFFNGKEVYFEKGAWLFRKRKCWSVPIAQLVSLRQKEDEWLIVYYDPKNEFFHEEIIVPPKGLNETFIDACKRNKIAILN